MLAIIKLMEMNTDGISSSIWFFSHPVWSEKMEAYLRYMCNIMFMHAMSRKKNYEKQNIGLEVLLRHGACMLMEVNNL